MPVATKYNTRQLRALSHRVRETSLDLCGRATPETRLAGEGWYDVANAEATLLAREFYVSVSRAAGVIAVLSPMTRWAMNVQDAWSAFAGDRMVHALPPSQRKARALVQGEPISQVLGGRKVIAFWQNIARPRYTLATTNDTWIARAFGVYPHDLFDRKGVYDAVTRGFVEAADRLGLRPHQVQATVWLQTQLENNVRIAELEASALPVPF